MGHQDQRETQAQLDHREHRVILEQMVLQVKGETLDLRDRLDLKGLQDRMVQEVQQESLVLMAAEVNQDHKDYVEIQVCI